MTVLTVRQLLFLFGHIIISEKLSFTTKFAFDIFVHKLMTLIIRMGQIYIKP